MKWFNFKEHFVVVLEEDDIFGPNSTQTYDLAEPTVRIFDKSRRYLNKQDYPLLAELRLSAFDRIASGSGGLELNNGVMLDEEGTRELFNFTYTLLVNSGALTERPSRLAA